MTWYVVFKGRVPGVYEHWDDAHRQVNGFKGNLYKGYPTRSIAEEHWRRSNHGRMGTAGYLVILP
ncbi:RNase H1/viroplasmin domain-containing protein, partial [Curtobacterium sp. ODYSSEY 48 V2]|uniref:RNase H1/viroplasmin domain-containing protein n=1 Tax=Curtobacterium sp. ODYSSEY 48 V2 TaxID=2939561 RepID=UPI00203DA62B